MAGAGTTAPSCTSTGPADAAAVDTAGVLLRILWCLTGVMGWKQTVGDRATLWTCWQCIEQDSWLLFLRVVKASGRIGLGVEVDKKVKNVYNRLQEALLVEYGLVTNCCQQ